VVRIAYCISAVTQPRAPAVAPQLPSANRFLLSPAETVVLLVFPMVFEGSWLTVSYSVTRPRAPAVASQLPPANRFLPSPAETVVLLVLPMVFEGSWLTVSFQVNRFPGPPEATRMRASASANLHFPKGFQGFPSRFHGNPTPPHPRRQLTVSFRAPPKQ